MENLSLLRKSKNPQLRMKTDQLVKSFVNERKRDYRECLEISKVQLSHEERRFRIIIVLAKLVSDNSTYFFERKRLLSKYALERLRDKEFSEGELISEENIEKIPFHDRLIYKLARECIGRKLPGGDEQFNSKFIDRLNLAIFSFFKGEWVFEENDDRLELDQEVLDLFEKVKNSEGHLFIFLKSIILNVLHIDCLHKVVETFFPIIEDLDTFLEEIVSEKTRDLTKYFDLRSSLLFLVSGMKTAESIRSFLSLKVLSRDTASFVFDERQYSEVVNQVSGYLFSLLQGQIVESDRLPVKNLSSEITEIIESKEFSFPW